jgi:hypothetical protein
VSPTEEHAWKRSEAVLIAVVTGVLSLVAASIGSYVGGRTANDGAKQIQKAEEQREVEKETAAARAAARLLAAELQEVEHYAQASLKSRHFVHGYPHALRVALPREDRRLLAAQLRVETWNAVIRAVAEADFVDSRARQFGVVADLNPKEVGLVRRRIARQFRSPVRETVRAFLTDLRFQARVIRTGVAALGPLAKGG